MAFTCFHYQRLTNGVILWDHLDGDGWGEWTSRTTIYFGVGVSRDYRSRTSALVAGSAAANLILEPGAEGNTKVSPLEWWRWWLGSVLLGLSSNRAMGFHHSFAGKVIDRRKTPGIFLAARVSEVSNQPWVWFATFQLLRHRSILESDYGRGCGLSDVGVGQVGLSLSDECLRMFENVWEFQCCRLANYPHFLQTLSLTEIISIICRRGWCPTSLGIQMGQPSPVLFRRIIGWKMLKGTAGLCSV